MEKNHPISLAAYMLLLGMLIGFFTGKEIFQKPAEHAYVSFGCGSTVRDTSFDNVTIKVPDSSDCPTAKDILGNNNFHY